MTFIVVLRQYGMDLSFITSPFAMRPGLSRLAPGQGHLATSTSKAASEKLAALTYPQTDALLLADGFDPLPGLRTLAHTAATEFVQHFELTNTAFIAHPVGMKYEFSCNRLMDTAQNAFLVNQLPPRFRVGWQGFAALLALALEEDFAIVDEPTKSLAMLGVALPSHWEPAQKIGLSFHAAHTPVADNQMLLAAGDGLMNLVTSGERWQRHVWVVTPSALRDAHPTRHVRKPWPALAELIQTCHLRVERQTFIPVADHAQAVFTIHVATTPLVDLCAHPGNASILTQALATQSDAVLAYRSMPTQVRDALVTQLSQIP